MIRTTKRRRRGNIVVLSCALITCILALVALAVDVGYIAHARTELQRTADAVALAAAAKLPKQIDAVDAGLATAQSNATSIATALNSSDFEFGWWNRRNSTFTTPAPANRQVNAVRVTVTRSAARGNPLQLFFGRVLDRNAADITVQSTGFMDRGLCGAFVGIQWLDINGTPQMDSYDSVDGPYNPATANQRGSGCSDGDITVSGSSVVSGDARAGAGDDVILNGGAVVEGNIGNRVKPLNMPPVDTSYVSTTNDNGLLPKDKLWRYDETTGKWTKSSPLDKKGDFTLNAGEVYDLPPGTYYFRDMIINGGATLNISGNTTIFITGNFTLAGGAYMNNNTQLASNLEIYMTGGAANVTSDTTFYGVIYAPNTDVTINGSGDFYGAAVGKTLKAGGGGSAHYDESLELEQVDPPTRSTIVD